MRWAWGLRRHSGEQARAAAPSLCFTSTHKKRSERKWLRVQTRKRLAHHRRPLDSPSADSFNSFPLHLQTDPRTPKPQLMIVGTPSAFIAGWKRSTRVVRGSLRMCGSTILPYKLFSFSCHLIYNFMSHQLLQFPSTQICNFWPFNWTYQSLFKHWSCYASFGRDNKFSAETHTHTLWE